MISFIHPFFKIDYCGGMRLKLVGLSFVHEDKISISVYDRECVKINNYIVLANIKCQKRSFLFDWVFFVHIFSVIQI